MRAQLRRMGNSSGVIVPKPVLAQLGVTVGDSLNLAVGRGASSSCQCRHTLARAGPTTRPARRLA